MEDDRHETSFLTVAEAAERLGTTRLRVREAVALSLLKARRDNEGRLRVDLPNDVALPKGKSTELDPEAVLEFLFDDIEELENEVVSRDARIATLTALLARQDEALERSDRILSELQIEKTRLAEMLDRAFSHLDNATNREARLQDVSDRAMETLDQTLRAAEAEAQKSAKLQDMLERAILLAEQGDSAHTVADRSLSLLEGALANAEAAQVASRRSDAMLERSLQAAEEAQNRLSVTNEQLTQREAELEKTLALSERAADLAQSNKQKRRKGFLRWLLGV
ncbi:MAG: hypothetical protein AAGF55_02700 [Pseudomonadota bacterium]